MPKYINLETTLAGIENVLREKSDKKDSLAYFALRLFAETLKQAPTADVVEVKHGKWKWFAHNSKTRTCSVCNISQTVNVYNNTVMFRYCPYCGAKMDLKEGD